MQMVMALDHASQDKRVQGIVACMSDAQQYAALAQVQELRNAILDFRYAAGCHASLRNFRNDVSSSICDC